MRVALSGIYINDYPTNYQNPPGVLWYGAGTHSLSSYIIHDRKIFNYPVSFRFGVKDMVDLKNRGKIYRSTGIASFPTATNPNLVESVQYTDVPSWSLSARVDF